jgi:hypothetical protein
VGAPSVPAGVALRLLGLFKPGHTIVVRLTGAATKPIYRWEICTRSKCRAINDATHASLRVRAAWSGQRLRVIVQVKARGARLLLTHDTSRIG